MDPSSDTFWPCDSDQMDSPEPQCFPLYAMEPTPRGHEGKSQMASEVVHTMFWTQSSDRAPAPAKNPDVTGPRCHRSAAHPSAGPSRLPDHHAPLTTGPLHLLLAILNTLSLTHLWPAILSSNVASLHWPSLTHGCKPGVPSYPPPFPCVLSPNQHDLQ